MKRAKAKGGSRKRVKSPEKEEGLDTFRRILAERPAVWKGPDKRPAELLLEWTDGEKSWVPRSALKGQEALTEWDNREEAQPEIICSDEELANKVAEIAKLLKPGKRIVWHIGAGISTSAGVPDFRGPQGLWTSEARDISDFDLTKVKPSFGHRALVELEKHGYVYWIVTQNYDDLFGKAGFPVDKLSEIHGNIFKEVCPRCGRAYHRAFPVPREEDDDHWNQEDNFDHSTDRQCDDCAVPLLDQIVHFGESLKGVALAHAKAKGAEVALALGTKLAVTPACDWSVAVTAITVHSREYICERVFYPHKKTQTSARGHVVIVNAQRTEKDSQADVLLHHRTDAFFRRLLPALELPLPE